MIIVLETTLWVHRTTQSQNFHMHLRLNYKNRIIIRESKTAEKITQKSLIDSKSMPKNKQKIDMKENPQNQVNFSHLLIIVY